MESSRFSLWKSQCVLTHLENLWLLEMSAHCRSYSSKTAETLVLCSVMLQKEVQNSRTIFFAISFQKNPFLFSGKAPWTSSYPQINLLCLNVLLDHLIKIRFYSLSWGDAPNLDFHVPLLDWVFVILCTTKCW